VRLAHYELAELIGDKLSYRELMRGGPRWLTGELCATEPARQKLRDWLKRTPRPWPEPDPEEILTSLEITGDKKMLHMLAQLLCRLPLPVSAYTLEKVTFVAVGMQSLGFCGARPSLGDRPFFIVLSAGDGTAEQMLTIAMHEIAHSWLMQEPGLDQEAGGAFFSSTVHDTPLAQVPPEAIGRVLELRKAYAHEERVAIALAREWCDMLKQNPTELRRNE